MTTERAANTGHPRRWPKALTDCGEHPAFTEPTEEPPPLEGELECVCGAPEGLHRADGCCELTGCSWFVPKDDAEGVTVPEIRVEYDAGEEPR